VERLEIDERVDVNLGFRKQPRPSGKPCKSGFPGGDLFRASGAAHSIYCVQVHRSDLSQLNAALNIIFPIPVPAMSERWTEVAKRNMANRTVSIGFLVEVDGHFVWCQDGGDGNDVIVANINLDSNSHGMVNAELMGEAGNDLLVFRAVGVGDPNIFTALVDGGAGFDIALVSRGIDLTSPNGRQTNRLAVKYGGSAGRLHALKKIHIREYNVREIII
jgi:hypothetical protein